MTACPDRSLVARLDEISRGERLALLEHLRSCATCRAALVADDPSRLFALLLLESLPASALEGVSSAVAAAVREGSLRRWATPGLAAAAAWTVAVLLAVGGGIVLRSPREPSFTGGQARAGVEVLSSPGTAQVVDLAVGDAQVVMIFDERLDL